MTTHVYDDASFRLMFPVFADDTVYPPALIGMWWSTGTGFVSAQDNCGINGDALQSALNMMAAHLLWSSVLIGRGQTTVGVMIGSSIDKISVSFQAPPMLNNWRSWLLTTPYGAMFLALMEAQAAGGFYVGGSPERDAFRNSYGIFG